MKVGRNDPCPCGSGQKYKKCCLAKDEAARSAELAALAAEAAKAAEAAADAEGEEGDAQGASGKRAAAPARAHDAATSRPKTSAATKPPAIRRKAV